MDKSTTHKVPIKSGDSLFEWGKRTYVMGIINATPDSFSGDGSGSDIDAALGRAVLFEKWGADIVDIGGESTRPREIYENSEPISTDAELSRVIPIIQAIKRETSIPISIDTYKAKVAKEAITAGACLINDVWGFQKDPDMVRIASESNVPVILMHNQTHSNYHDLVTDVISRLAWLKDNAISGGVARNNIILDPGMGFGKTMEHNLVLLRRLEELSVLESPILVGMSRKSTIGDVLDLPVNDRIEGTSATVSLSIAKGADLVRVHDVKEMVRVARMSDAIVRGQGQE